MNDWYELWSKAGANPNFRVQNPEQYILGFNWIGNWIDKYFFNKVSDFLLGIIFLSLVIFTCLIRTYISILAANLDLIDGVFAFCP